MRYLCIHNHFYQPPRENPWLEAIELQDSAYPYHDWNERITAECYAPNATARILDADQRISQIVNNYSRISFNFGPTFLSWAREKSPEVYNAILEADKESVKRHNGHGSAIAQVYNHMILPLANRRDKYTQVLWGLKDFEARFQRPSEGMWLPETAVDIETLEVLAELGIKFTILAPHQAKRVRKMGRASWKDVSNATIDPTRAYRQKLPSGRHIDLFFYDGPVSRAVAFEKLLDNGETFANRLTSAYNDERPWEQLVHIATDGESYGHHHKHGEMALAYALHHIESNGLATITNYGEYLERFPPTHEVEIIENTAWSCAHGVERWKSDCGCNAGSGVNWNQEWRAGLRQSMDWLRDTVGLLFEQGAKELLRDPWASRDDYVSIILDRSPNVRRAFVERNALHPLDDGEQVRVWKLMEMQRHAMLMFTSCAWFFDEISGLETVQALQYAGRVVQLAEDLFHKPVEEEFLDHLRTAKSNIPGNEDGAVVFQKFVKPAMIGLEQVAAHYAISSLFHSYEETERIYSYTMQRLEHHRHDAGRMRMGAGKLKACSQVTQECAELTFGVIYFGEHNLVGGVRRFLGDENYDALLAEFTAAFERADIPEVIRLLDKGFGGNTYSLKSLFRDEQRRILSEILNSSVEEAETAYRQLYEHHAALMRFLTDLHMPPPGPFRTTAEYALNSMIRNAVANGHPDLERVRAAVDEASSAGLRLDETTLEYPLRQQAERLAIRLQQNPGDAQTLELFDNYVALIKSLPFHVHLWKVQNYCWGLLQNAYPAFEQQAASGDEEAGNWVVRFRQLAERLSLRVA